MENISHDQPGKEGDDIKPDHVSIAHQRLPPHLPPPARHDVGHDDGQQVRDSVEQKQIVPRSRHDITPQQSMQGPLQTTAGALQSCEQLERTMKGPQRARGVNKGQGAAYRQHRGHTHYRSATLRHPLRSITRGLRAGRHCLPTRDRRLSPRPHPTLLR